MTIDSYEKEIEKIRQSYKTIKIGDLTEESQKIIENDDCGRIIIKTKTKDCQEIKDIWGIYDYNTDIEKTTLDIVPVNVNHELFFGEISDEEITEQKIEFEALSDEEYEICYNIFIFSDSYTYINSKLLTTDDLKKLEEDNCKGTIILSFKNTWGEEFQREFKFVKYREIHGWGNFDKYLILKSLKLSDEILENTYAEIDYTSKKWYYNPS